MDDAQVFLATGGGDAIDTAAKLARRFFVEAGHPRREHLVGRTHGYHGTHGFGTSLGGIEANRDGMGPARRRTVSVVAHDSLEALEAELRRVGPDRVAAFFVEPVIGAGGVLPPAAGLRRGGRRAVPRARRRCSSSTASSAASAGWAPGSASSAGTSSPDMITFAKGVTSGYLPLGGVVVGGRIAEPFFAAPGGPVFRHGATYAGHPTCCAAALANLDLLEREGCSSRGPRAGGRAARTRCARSADHPLVAEVRSGIGAPGRRRLSRPTPPPARPPASGPRPARVACSCARWGTRSRSRRR